MSLIFLIISKGYMNNYNLPKSKVYLFCSMLTIGWLFVYDIIIILSYIENIIDIFLLGWIFYITQIIVIINLTTLYLAYKDLLKAEKPVENMESTDWFYEKLDEKEK